MLWFQKDAAPIEHFCQIGTECYLKQFLRPKQKKWSEKSVPGILVCYCEDCDGNRLYVVPKIVTSRDVVFKLTVQNEREDVKSEGTKNYLSLTQYPPVIFSRSGPCVDGGNQKIGNIIQIVENGVNDAVFWK